MAQAPESTNPLYDLRRRNLKRITTMYGGPTRVAALLGLKSASYLSQLASGHRPIKEDRARSIETTLKLELGWMDQEHEGVPVFGERDPGVTAPRAAPAAAAAPVTAPASNMVTDVVLSVGAILEDSGIEVSPAKFATIVDLVLQNATSHGAIDEAFVRKVISLLNTADKTPK